MGKRPIAVDEVWQNLIERLFHENIICDPEQVQRFFVSNLVQRTLAHVVGKGRSGRVLIEATEAGELKVATVGTGLEDYDYAAATAASDAAIAFNSTETWSGIEIVVEDHPALVRLSPDGTRWGAWFTVKVGETYNKDISCSKLEIKNAGAGNNHTHRMWGYY